MKKKLVFSSLLTLFVALFCCTAISTLAKHVFADTTSINFNTEYSLEHQCGVNYSYVLTSNYNKYCVLELRGNNMYSITISSSQSTWYTCGTDLTIEFQDSSSTSPTYTINFYCAGTGTENSTFKVRKMVAVLYGFDYYGINTIPDLNVPYNDFSPKLTATKYTSSTLSIYTSFLSNDSIRNIKRIDSDLFFFSGHGSPVEIQGPVAPSFVNTYVPTLSCCKIAVLAACETAKTPTNGSEYSIAQTFVVKGTKTSIGWNETIGVSYSKIFTDKLFNELNNGSTFSNAASAAKAQFLFGNIKNYTIFGNGNTKMFTGSQVTNTSNSTALSLNDDFCYIDCGNNYYQLCRTINGRITNQVIFAYNKGIDYYEISKTKNFDNNFILLTDKYSKEIYKIIDEKINEIDDAYDISYYSFYEIDEGVATPIIVAEFSYLDKNWPENMIIGFNLNNGQEINPLDYLVIDYEK